MSVTARPGRPKSVVKRPKEKGRFGTRLLWAPEDRRERRIVYEIDQMGVFRGVSWFNPHPNESICVIKALECIKVTPKSMNNPSKCKPLNISSGYASVFYAYVNS